MKPKISILIATYNRPQKLSHCLQSILKSTYQDYEVLMLDQSHSSLNKKGPPALLQKCWGRGFTAHRLRHFPLNFTGKSKALNYGIQKSRGQILAFTDDDCIVDPKWLETIVYTFKKYPKLKLWFGQTKSYQSEKHKSETCPCIFSKKPNKLSITTKPCKHWEHIGFGNNMAIKVDVFEKLGGFKKWLGPGSIGKAAEDAEFSLRALVNGYNLGYQPKMLVYHDKWLDKSQYLKQLQYYSKGEIFCYGWFAICGHKFAKSIIKKTIQKLF